MVGFLPSSPVLGHWQLYSMLCDVDNNNNNNQGECAWPIVSRLYSNVQFVCWHVCAIQSDFWVATVLADLPLLYLRGPCDLYGSDSRTAQYTVKYNAGMNLLSKFCIAVSAIQKLNCVAVGVICVAVFFWCVLEKK